jgi:hypothetical protein
MRSRGLAPERDDGFYLSPADRKNEFRVVRLGERTRLETPEPRVCGGWLVPPRTQGITENFRLRDRRPVPFVFIGLFLARRPSSSTRKTELWWADGVLWRLPGVKS